jgi:hypothetical protein
MWWAQEVNPLCGDCFARSAIRWHRVDTGSSSDALALFPPNDSRTRRPLPSPGSGRHPFPRFLGPRGRSDTLPSLSPRFGVSLGDTCPCAWVRSSLPARRRPAAWSFEVRPLPASVLSSRKRQGFPGSWGTLVCLCPVLGPRQDRAPQAVTVCRHGPRLSVWRGLLRLRNCGAG